MHDWLTARADATPDALALVTAQGRWTYAELAHATGRMAAHLAAHGVQPGDRVAALLPDDATYVRVIHALARIGAVLVPLNRRLVRDELAWQIGRIGCGMLLCSAQTAELAASAASEARLLLVDGSLVDDSPVPTPDFTLHRDQAIVFTSGTTGRPKGAVITFANHFWSATASSYRLGIRADDRWLSCLPLYHVGGLAVIFRSCLYGTVVMLHDGFDLDRFNASLDRDRITLTSLTPTMFHRLLDARPGAWPDTLRAVLLGGAAASPELLARALSQGLPVAPTYGLTEAASQVATMRPGGADGKTGSVGKPLMFTRVRIADEEGRTLPAGEDGEIVVSGPTVMRGYYDDAEATAEAIRGGELFTGDIGYLDGDGDLWVLQRRSELIVTGGENVYPAEVERVLAQHPGVIRACVVGIPDPEWGQRVAAVVELTAPDSVTDQLLIAHCRGHLAGYKLPRMFVFTDALPQTASGKIERRAVIDSLARGRLEIEFQADS